MSFADMKKKRGDKLQTLLKEKRINNNSILNISHNGAGISEKG